MAKCPECGGDVKLCAGEIGPGDFSGFSFECLSESCRWWRDPYGDECRGPLDWFDDEIDEWVRRLKHSLGVNKHG